ncbi:MAG: IS110 family transposase [Candidatus Midichloria sp.]|nr:IS110 family transposase [Candidatus Midichloria sp.]
MENFKHAKQFSTIVRLNPTTTFSGRSVRGSRRIGKIGNHILRKALFLPTMIACKFIENFAARLESKRQNGYCSCDASHI